MVSWLLRSSGLCCVETEANKPTKELQEVVVVQVGTHVVVLWGVVVVCLFRGFGQCSGQSSCETIVQAIVVCLRQRCPLHRQRVETLRTQWTHRRSRKGTPSSHNCVMIDASYRRRITRCLTMFWLRCSATQGGGF